MTTPASADPGVSVTLYKAVTATVTWEQVRTAAKAMGMRAAKLEGPEEIEAWVHASGRRIYLGGDADDMGHEIGALARVAGTSPGEMLERIAGATEYASDLPLAKALKIVGALRSEEGYSCSPYRLVDVILALDDALAQKTSAAAAPSYPGAVPWRSRAHVSAVIQALVYRDATDTQAADFLAAHLEDIWADYMRRLTLEPVPMKFVSPTAQKAVEDMRDRCAKEARAEADTCENDAGQYVACLDVEKRIRALPLTAEPAGAWVSDETGHPSTADVIRDAVKAWAALHGGRVARAVVETPSVEEPDAGPYDDRCRWFLGNSGARCRYIFDHHKRGVPCAARTSAAPPVADASAELRARLVAELHAAGRPEMVRGVWYCFDLTTFAQGLAHDVRRMLSADLRCDLGIEVPK